MRSNAGMANRQGDVDLRFAQVSAPQLTLLLGLASLRSFNTYIRGSYINKDKSALTPRRSSQLQHQEGLGSTVHQDGQPAPILQGAICRRRPNGVGLSVTSQKGVTSFGTKHHNT